MPAAVTLGIHADREAIEDERGHAYGSLHGDHVDSTPIRVKIPHVRQSSNAPRGACRREPLTNDPGQWTYCPDCLTVFDDYGKAVNPIPKLRPRNAVKTFPTTTH
jgi:hypothetical protein